MSKQISQLNSTNELNDNDIFPVVNDNTTKKLSFANLKTLLAQLFITNETDPTVPSWAKASKKPSYSTSELTNDSGFVTKEVNNLTNYELKTKTGSTIEFSIDNTTHNITLKLKNSNGDILSEKTIQLENFVTESDFSTFTTQLNQVLQSLNETKADAEDVEALQNEIEENYKVITKLQEENEDLKKNQLTNTPTPATSHYLQDSADSRFRKFIPIGRTTQESTSGKNLFDKDTVANGKYINDSGKVANSPNLCMSSKIQVNAGETYTISGLIQGEASYQWNVSYWNGDTYLSRELKGVLSYTFVIPANCTHIILSLWITDLSKVQLEKSSTATEWELFTGRRTST